MTEFSAPIAYTKIQELANNDIERQENGREPIIAFGTECRIGFFSSWWARLIWRISTFDVQWPYAVPNGARTIAFKLGDPAYASLRRALLEGRL
jgi:hypothetical protein